MRTHDLEQDADLWKDGLFSRRVTRYVCLSKTQGRPEHVLESLLILPDKEFPPEGYSIISNTSDSNSKAFKKKQLCYRLTPFKSQADSIVDVIILSKLKGASGPDSYESVGDVNGMHFCVRKISALTRLSTPGLSYGILPGAVLYPKLQEGMANLSFSSGDLGTDNRRTSSASTASAGAAYPASYPASPQHFLNNGGNNGYQQQQYQMVAPEGHYYPSGSGNYGTLTLLGKLDGVPFKLRADLVSAKGMNGVGGGSNRRFGGITAKTQSELEHKVKN